MMFPIIHGLVGASGSPAVSAGAVIYTGDGLDNRNITGLGLQPDLLFVSARSDGAGVETNVVVDSMRGSSLWMTTNQLAGEVTDADAVQAFQADGFQVGTAVEVNASGETYVGIGWKEGVAEGFDIVTYTGTGSAHTIAHSLGVVPDLIIVKRREANNSKAWRVFHSGLNAGTTPEQWYVAMTSNSKENQLTTMWNDAAPTSSVFSVGTHNDVNINAGTFVAYLFAAKAGKSAFGEYAGSGAEKAITGLGFSPGIVLIKSSATGNRNWALFDTARGATKYLPLNLAAATVEVTAAQSLKSFDADGFTLGTSQVVNASGNRFIWSAWA